jgi:hypothetical protein
MTPAASRPCARARAAVAAGEVGSSSTSSRPGGSSPRSSRAASRAAAYAGDDGIHLDGAGLPVASGTREAPFRGPAGGRGRLSIRHAPGMGGSFHDGAFDE